MSLLAPVWVSTWDKLSTQTGDQLGLYGSIVLEREFSMNIDLNFSEISRAIHDEITEGDYAEQ